MYSLRSLSLRISGNKNSLQKGMTLWEKNQGWEPPGLWCGRHLAICLASLPEFRLSPGLRPWGPTAAQPHPRYWPRSALRQRKCEQLTSPIPGRLGSGFCSELSLHFQLWLLGPLGVAVHQTPLGSLRWNTD